MGEVESAPFFEDLYVGLGIGDAPGFTLTSGNAAVHQSIVGDRLGLATDAELARQVAGTQSALAHPALVWDVAIGQSTLITKRVVANLFYRGLAFKRMPVIGDTLRTTTEVVALRRNRVRPDRTPTGLAVLRIKTVDQHERAVLDFCRCAMLPLGDTDRDTWPCDDIDAIGSDLDLAPIRSRVADWRLDLWTSGKERNFCDLRAGTVWTLAGGDVVSAAPELARLTLNVATAHHVADANPAGKRLVYGGHTIGLACAQATRLLPNMVCVLAWHSCDHLAPVCEGDTLQSTLELETVEPLSQAGRIAHLRSRVYSQNEQVLDWRFVAVVAHPW
jgi:acyl dehydratase